MVMLKGGIASRLVNFAVTLVGHLPGGLGMGMVLSMGFFAAFCGSILAAITAVGTIMMPRMVEQGYPRPFVIVLAASAGLLEALIPPSNAAILFRRPDQCAGLTHVFSRHPAGVDAVGDADGGGGLALPAACAIRPVPGRPKGGALSKPRCRGW